LRKNVVFNNEKIKKHNLKNILFDNKPKHNKDKDKDKVIIQNKYNEPEKAKVIQNKENDTIKEINNETEETLVEDSVIVNDSEVYGTFTLKSTLENGKNKEAKNSKNNKENYNNNKEKQNNNNNNNNNSDKRNIKNTNNKNLPETIKINYSDNNYSSNQNKQFKIEDIIKEKNQNQNQKKYKKENENILFFKSYYSQSIAGKNYGSKKTNQDMPVTFINLNGIKGFNIFGVLDGHGVNGHHVSKFLSEYLVKQIINSKEISGITNLDAIYQIMKRANYELLITVFLNADKMLGKQKFDVSFSGTTCVLVIQIGRNLICANVGDSRAILIYDKYGDKNLKNPAIFELSHDFKPDLPDEKKRILLLGGMVEQMMDINGFRGGPQRVWAKNKNFPGLAMSRSLGDYKGKQCGIIPLPEFIEYKLNEESKYMVICSDGVWEFLSNKNVMEIGNRYYLKNDIHGFTQRLIQISEKMWEKTDVIVDDITAVIVYF
jgi:serine/threonine protein phosphatase PrpC